VIDPAHADGKSRIVRVRADLEALHPLNLSLRFGQLIEGM